MATVEFQNVEIRYPGADTATVEDMNLTIGDGEFLVLVGPSGCGKSTTLRALAGLEQVSGGSIRIGGEDVTAKEPGDRDIAMVFQDYALYPHMSVAENMGFALKVAKRPKKEIAQRVREAASILGLEEFLDRKPKDLSGGQRQRVAMGRAIVRQPQVFLMDEPLSNLDAKLRVQTRAQIVKLQKDLAVTTVYVTHDQVEAMTMGDRVAVLNKGDLQQVDAPKKLYEEPANAFVAGFIGSPAMNLLRVNGSVDGWDLPMPDGVGSSEVIVGLRPEGLRVSTESGAGLQGTVTMVEELGADSYIYADTQFGQIVARGGDTREAPTVNSSVTIHPQQGALVHYFDAKTEERIASLAVS
ncbi:sn-glycerol-3-phosphate ABC transporter ATP-binding protein UgpC [Corynebacterium sp. zg254]|uniref:Sn-glycerol-3-phosphate ABC transporter ATP-binding protein UgpC n=1 Tax=Corynebacterium zhongnanshanii TaxID=2768834 RepID=A0ABQ6VF57_9CORY|nr:MULTISPECIES: sn-glycerol-3-phosphate ABC transporter ATP-binding protein UgpC [Corynebacterium]KAB3522958.1 sn-glycerol-3-phosphate ABC transporter ATP-binding protein UgpC [Corynebacterium zhongnanshanii]MCR5913960.1 sn-glycerol-3-phosphate ABC transporter ATP-binding protein UgpC [Corynebacterium sp. zg254]